MQKLSEQSTINMSKAFRLEMMQLRLVWRSQATFSSLQEVHRQLELLHCTVHPNKVQISRLISTARTVSHWRLKQTERPLPHSPAYCSSWLGLGYFSSVTLSAHSRTCTAPLCKTEDTFRGIKVTKELLKAHRTLCCSTVFGLCIVLASLQVEQAQANILLGSYHSNTYKRKKKKQQTHKTARAYLVTAWIFLLTDYSYRAPELRILGTTAQAYWLIFVIPFTGNTGIRWTAA